MTFSSSTDQCSVHNIVGQFGLKRYQKKREVMSYKILKSQDLCANEGVENQWINAGFFLKDQFFLTLISNLLGRLLGFLSCCFKYSYFRL